MNNLEPVFPVGHQYHTRIFYDKGEGKYYDLHTDFFIEADQLPAFGL